MEKKIRVLHILDALNTGGADQIVYSYYCNIDRSKYQWDFIVMKVPGQKGRLEEPIEKMGGHIYHVTKKQESLRKNVHEVNEIIKNGNYDIVHSHLYEVSALYLYCAKKNGVKVRIGHSHSAHETRGWKIDLFRILLKPLLFYSATDKAACGIDAAKSLWGTTKNVTIVKNAIDIDKFRYSENEREIQRRKFQISDDTCVIGTVGRMCFQKNSLYLIDIFYEFQKLRPHSKLLYIGEGDDRSAVEHKIIDYDIQDKVLLLGRRNDVNKIYNAFDYFLLPSVYEGLPIVMVETQCNGLISFISDTITKEICLSENVHQLSIKANPILWAKEMNSICQLTYDRESGSIFVKNAGYDIIQQGFQLDKYYQKLLGKHR